MHSPSLALIGATGNLGRHVARQTLERGWPLSVAVRDRRRLAPDVEARAQVSELNLDTASLAQLAGFVDGHEVLVFCAGVVTQGEAFVAMVDKVVSALETLPAERRPVCWFLGGAALLDLDAAGRRGVELPKVRDTYWPHRVNHERLQRSALDWRLLCPGPMVDQEALGVAALRVSANALPAPLPALARVLAGPLLLPLFVAKIPQMIVPYADAAALILEHVHRSDPFARCRVGLALPPGMKGRKSQWAARARDTHDA